MHPATALRRAVERGAPRLPEVDAFRDLYAAQIIPRSGDVIMIVGREGSGKSTLALYLAQQMQLETLYFCADMSDLEATQKLASQITGIPYLEIEERMYEGRDTDEVYAAFDDTKIDIEFGHIEWEDIELSLDEWVEERNRFPEVIVVDNLMDVGECYGDYTLQEEAMSLLKRLGERTGSTIIVMHHTTKPERGTVWSKPPATNEIKGNLGRVPQMILSVALDPDEGMMNVSCLKQRMGPCDKGGKVHARLRALLDINTFAPEGVKTFEPKREEVKNESDDDTRRGQLESSVKVEGVRASRPEGVVDDPPRKVLGSGREAPPRLDGDLGKRILIAMAEGGFDHPGEVDLCDLGAPPKVSVDDAGPAP